MTLEELEQLPREMLTPAQIAPVYGADPQLIRIQARERPELLGFPVSILGSRVKIPKRPFIRFMRELTTEGSEST